MHMHQSSGFENEGTVVYLEDINVDQGSLTTMPVCLSP